MGEREGSTERPKQAVDAYRAALQELTRERVPLKWGGTQHDLGCALQILGERESGTERLVQATDAYHAALEVLTAEASARHADVQKNLDRALKTLREREARQNT